MDGDDSETAESNVEGASGVRERNCCVRSPARVARALEKLAPGVRLLMLLAGTVFNDQ